MQNSFPDLHTFVIVLSYLGILFLLTIFRVICLGRANRRLVAHAENLEKQVLTQQREIIANRQDSNAWRGALQVQFDTFRAESSRRLEDSEMRYDQAIKQQERQFGELKSALAQTVQKSPAPVSASLPPPAPAIEAEMVLPRIEEIAEPAAAE